MQGVVAVAALPLHESLLIAWPLAVVVAAAVIVLFVATYVAFQLQGSAGLTRAPKPVSSDSAF
jgi:hypothetical protein